MFIYKGARAALLLRGNASTEALTFVEEHRRTEQAHLDLFKALLPPSKHTKLLPAWRAAGWILGFLPALAGDRCAHLLTACLKIRGSPPKAPSCLPGSGDMLSLQARTNIMGCLGCAFADLFLTIEAVETFVEEHYGEQIGPLSQPSVENGGAHCPNLLALLRHCCEDEIHHKEDAASRVGGGSRTRLEQAWMSVVRIGSAVAAEIARRV